MTSNYEKALESIISLGIERVLTSGRENTALEGTPIIKRMVDLVSISRRSIVEHSVYSDSKNEGLNTINMHG